jgi:uncharacterized cofD-like protein
MKEKFKLFYLLRNYIFFWSGCVLISLFLLYHGKNFWGLLTAFLILFFCFTFTVYNILKDKKLFRKARFLVPGLGEKGKEFLQEIKIVAIGGGTGLPAVLQGLKAITSHISAVVTMFDDGGSSGKLREQLQILPPGDIRNCLFALSQEDKIMQELFQYRFKRGDLEGHPVGNILLAAIAKLYAGDMKKGISHIEKILSIRGRVIPITFSDATLCAIKSKNKVVIKGESQLNKVQGKFFDIYVESKNGKIEVNPDVIAAIEDAEVITLGPGSLFTSIIPNLLLKEVTEALNAATAPIIYICNLMTESGETDGFSVTDHLKAIFKFTNLKKVDYVIYNIAPIPEKYLEKYRLENAYPVKVDTENFKHYPQTKFTGDNIMAVGDTLRHDSAKIAKIIKEIYEKVQFTN